MCFGLMSSIIKVFEGTDILELLWLQQSIFKHLVRKQHSLYFTFVKKYVFGNW
jgi:hypothetical protein